MHELAITQEIVKILKSECRDRKITPKKVVVELGDFTSYKKEPLIYYYDILKKDSEIISDTELIVQEVQGEDLKIKEIIV